MYGYLRIKTAVRYHPSVLEVCKRAPLIQVRPAGRRSQSIIIKQGKTSAIHVSPWRHLSATAQRPFPCIPKRSTGACGLCGGCVVGLSYLYRPLFLRINQAVSQSVTTPYHPSPAPALSFRASTESLSTFPTFPTPYYVR